MSVSPFTTEWQWIISSLKDVTPSDFYADLQLSPKGHPSIFMGLEICSQQNTFVVKYFSRGKLVEPADYKANCFGVWSSWDGSIQTLSVPSKDKTEPIVEIPLKYFLAEQEGKPFYFVKHRNGEHLILIFEHGKFAIHFRVRDIPERRLVCSFLNRESDYNLDNQESSSSSIALFDPTPRIQAILKRFPGYYFTNIHRGILDGMFYNFKKQHNNFLIKVANVDPFVLDYAREFGVSPTIFSMQNGRMENVTHVLAKECRSPAAVATMKQFQGQEFTIFPGWKSSLLCIGQIVPGASPNNWMSTVSLKTNQIFIIGNTIERFNDARGTWKKPISFPFQYQENYHLQRFESKDVHQPPLVKRFPPMKPRPPISAPSTLAKGSSYFCPLVCPKPQRLSSSSSSSSNQETKTKEEKFNYDSIPYEDLLAIYQPNDASPTKSKDPLPVVPQPEAITSPNDKEEDNVQVENEE